MSIQFDIAKQIIAETCPNFIQDNIDWTPEFAKFYDSLANRVMLKFDYVFEIVKTERIVSTKFVKHLANTDLYEMRVSVGGNEYRTIMFTMDNRNVVLATKIMQTERRTIKLA